MYIATIQQISSIEAYAQAGISAICLGVEGLSIRANQYLSIEELKQYKQEAEKHHMRVYVNALKLFMEDEMDIVEQRLSDLMNLHIDGLYFADEGILYLCKELGWSGELIYQPETLITNAQDVAFYRSQGVTSVSLAHELSLNEISKIALQQSKVEVLVSGYYSILYSRRKLVSNYLNFIENETDKRQFKLIEQTREDEMFIVEDANGTHIFSEQPMQSGTVLETLKEMGIQRYRIDNIFMDDQWTIEEVQAYQNQTKRETDHWYNQESIRKKEDAKNV